MPIGVQTPITSHTGNGTATVFAYDFAILSADDIRVNVDGTIVTTGFTVAGIGDRDGGTVTFSAAPSSGVEVLLYREVSRERATDYQYAGDLREDVLDDDIDRIVMALQEDAELIARGIRVPVGESLSELPAAASRVDKVLTFGAGGAIALVDVAAFAGGGVVELVPADGSITMTKLTTAVQALVNGALQKSGGTMTGALMLAGNAANALEAVPKQQLDASVAAAVAPLAGRNRVINGTFAVNQRAFAGGALSAGNYGHDRWKAGAGGATYTVSGETATIAVGTLAQVIEGLNVPEGGTYTLSWFGTAQARVDGGSYAASPITVTGKTAGSNITIEFATGTVTRVQFEAGSTATTYERRLYAAEVVLCMRYFMTSTSVGSTLYSGNCANGSFYNTTVRFPVLMRATPVMTGSDAGAFGFPSVGSLAAGPGWFTESRMANSTQTPGYYASSWTASAEL